ncbi:hypothetical protein V9T40_008208 [Parthenolecanium corni]|uniref:Uncharacterized protein n=1 Tax=Parthenolecanium corni TaxID=536013 RepID=A0AAN9TNY7_9HEMI
MKKRLGLQPRSKSECKELDEERSEFTQPTSSQKSKKPEKVKKRQLSHFSSSCLIFRLVVSFFVQHSQFSSRCPNFRLVVPSFVLLLVSLFSFRCLNFRLDVPI